MRLTAVVLSGLMLLVGLVGCLEAEQPDPQGRDHVGELVDTATLTAVVGGSAYEINRAVASETRLDIHVANTLSSLIEIPADQPNGPAGELLGGSEHVHLAFGQPETLGLQNSLAALDATDVYIVFNTTRELAGPVLVGGPSGLTAVATSYPVADVGRAALDAVDRVAPGPSPQPPQDEEESGDAQAPGLPVDPIFPPSFDDDWEDLATDIQTRLGIEPLYTLTPAVQKSHISFERVAEDRLAVTIDEGEGNTSTFELGFEERKHRSYVLALSDVPSGIELDPDGSTVVMVSLAPGALAPHDGDPQERTREILDRLGIPVEDGRWRSIEHGPDATDLLLRTKLIVICPNCTTQVYHTPEVRGANWAIVTFTADGFPVRVTSHRWIEPNASRTMPLGEARQGALEVMEQEGLSVKDLWFSHYGWNDHKQQLVHHWDADARRGEEDEWHRYSLETHAVTGRVVHGPGAGIGTE